MQAVEEASPPAAAPVGPTALAPTVDAAPAPDAVTDVAMGDGWLVVYFDQLVAARSWKLLASADLDHVVLRLTGVGVDLRVVVPKAALAGGTTSHTFTGLPDGDFEVTVEAEDAAGNVLGRDAHKASVRAGAETAEALLPCSAVPDLAVDGAGAAWYIDRATSTLVKVDATGTTLASARSALHPNRLHVDPNGHVWAYTGTHLEFFDPNDTSGHLPGDEYVARFAPDGTFLAYYHIGPDVEITKLEVSSDGTMWVGTFDHGLIRLKADVPFAP